jgi:hypothetical protein
VRVERPEGQARTSQPSWLAQDHPRIKQRIAVCLERTGRRTEDGILLLPASEFVERLGALF